jgi:hypothetical protein
MGSNIYSEPASLEETEVKEEVVVEKDSKETKEEPSK